MHNAPDRDNYIEIRLNNAKSSEKGNFDKLNSLFVGHFGSTYDYESIMHCDAYAFTQNGLPTVIPKVCDTFRLQTHFDTYLPFGIFFSRSGQSKIYYYWTA